MLFIQDKERSGHLGTTISREHTIGFVKRDTKLKDFFVDILGTKSHEKQLLTITKPYQEDISFNMSRFQLDLELERIVKCLQYYCLTGPYTNDQATQFITKGAFLWDDPDPDH